MRLIKFRAWDKLKKKMLDWEGILSAQNVGVIFEMKRVTLQQFTGLKDKDGKEIYEGDIINKGYYMKPFLVKDIRIDTLTLARMIKFRKKQKNISGFKIIGNIYENPKLLEDKK